LLLLLVGLLLFNGMGQREMKGTNVLFMPLSGEAQRDTYEIYFNNIIFFFFLIQMK
jgi:hypothetical protein